MNTEKQKLESLFSITPQIRTLLLVQTGLKNIGR